MSWGDEENGGDCSAVQAQLQDVLWIQACDAAFAAILADGSVVTWGDLDIVAQCSAVQPRLQNVQSIQAQRVHVGMWYMLEPQTSPNYLLGRPK